MNEIKISIIVLSYNQESYIGQTIESILSQDHNYSYELLICDDASKDRTPEIISLYAKNHKIIKPILRKKNLGVVNNFYDAISKSIGQYIMVCGGDDYYLPGKIKKQIDYLEKNPQINLLHGDMKVINGEGQIISHSYGPRSISYKELLFNNKINTPTIVIRRKELDRYIHDIQPIEKKWLIEDRPLMIWFSLESKIKYLSGEVTAYRVLNGSISHPNTTEKLISYIESSYDVNTFYQEKYPESITQNDVKNAHIDSLLQHIYYFDREYQSYCIKVINDYKRTGFRIGLSRELRVKIRLYNIFWKIINKIKFKYFKKNKY